MSNADWVVPMNAELTAANELEAVKAERDKLKRELTLAYRNNHKRNLELDALHYVWCDGGCETGVHRFEHKGPLTLEIVNAAIQNTERVISYYRRKASATEPLGNWELRGKVEDLAQQIETLRAREAELCAELQRESEYYCELCKDTSRVHDYQAIYERIPRFDSDNIFRHHRHDGQNTDSEPAWPCASQKLRKALASHDPAWLDGQLEEAVKPWKALVAKATKALKGAFKIPRPWMPTDKKISEEEWDEAWFSIASALDNPDAKTALDWHNRERLAAVQCFALALEAALGEGTHWAPGAQVILRETLEKCKKELR